MAKITAEQLEIAQGWQKFGNRLGWNLWACQTDKATFTRNELTFTVWLQQREDIERTWRDREGQPKVQPVNVAKIGGA